jgi:hypothetical protein
MQPARLRIRLAAWLAFSLLLGLGLAVLDGQGSRLNGSLLRGWLAYSLLIGLGTGGLFLFRRLLGLDARAGKAALAAFLARLLVGAALTLLLPVLGYQDENATASQAGYFYQDAFGRDRRAWNLALEGEPLSVAFDAERSKDQYGTLLFLSMAVYRYLSPDAHRKMLVLVLTAAAGALGTLFVWKAAREWFGEGVARPAGWIFALYPEAIVLGASQMREGFVLSGVAMAFWGLIQARREEGRGLAGQGGQGQASRRLLSLHRWGWFGGGILMLLVFHPPTALIALIVLLGLWFLDPFHRRFSVRQVVMFAGALLLAVLLIYAVWSRLPSLRGSSPAGFFVTWLQNNFNYQSYRLERASGRMQQLIDEAGEAWWPAIVAAYGVAQPVLPGTLFEPAPTIWKVVNILRSLGWYALAPFLVYAVFAALRASPGERRAQMLWLSLATWVWILLSALNAGGDLWDNPRYRVVFLAFQALLAAWAWGWAFVHRDAWLRRLLWTEAIFVLFFMQWYASRYTRIFSRLPFWEMVAAILALSALIMGIGWVRDRRKRSKQQSLRKS